MDRDISSYQDMPAESLLILEDDLGIKHTVHTTVFLPCGTDGSHRARHACRGPARTLLRSYYAAFYLRIPV